MKKKIVLVGVLVILLVGSVSAGLIDYFGKIKGSVVVSGPVFYLSDTEVVINDVASRALNLNTFDGNNSKRSFTGINSQWFVTEELGVGSFYSADYDFYIKACAENNTETDLIGQIDLTLRVLHSDGDSGDIICGTSIENIQTVGSCGVNNYIEYPISGDLTCSGDELNLDSTDRLVLIASDGLHPITYYIKMDGYSRVEVMAT